MACKSFLSIIRLTLLQKIINCSQYRCVKIIAKYSIMGSEKELNVSWFHRFSIHSNFLVSLAYIIYKNACKLKNEVLFLAQWIN